jgi:hypothetical protein
MRREVIGQCGGASGFCDAVVVAPDRVLLSTWHTRRCLLVDLKSRAILPQPIAAAANMRLPAGDCLASPTASSGKPFIFAVASRSWWASVWQEGDVASRTVECESGVVNATALNSKGDILALGTGFYPLDPANEPQAAVELWSLGEDGEQFINRRSLPGVAVDQLCWTAHEDRLVVVSGSRSQSAGHLVVLSVEGLQILDVVDLRSAFCGAMRISEDDDRVAIVLRGLIETRSLDELSNPGRRMSVDPTDYRSGISRDLRTVLMTNGCRVDLVRREVQRLPEIQGYQCVVQLDDGRIFGVDGDGIGCLWVPGSDDH